MCGLTPPAELEREKTLIIKKSEFKSVEGDVQALKDSVNEHEYDGDVTVYSHHGNEVENLGAGDKTYTAGFSSGDVSLDNLAAAVANIPVSKGTIVHGACYVLRNGERYKVSVQLLPPEGRTEKRVHSVNGKEKNIM